MHHHGANSVEHSALSCPCCGQSCVDLDGGALLIVWTGIVAPSTKTWAMVWTRIVALYTKTWDSGTLDQDLGGGANLSRKTNRHLGTLGWERAICVTTTFTETTRRTGADNNNNKNMNYSISGNKKQHKFSGGYTTQYIATAEAL